MVEDYLNIISGIILLAEELDSISTQLTGVERITANKILGIEDSTIFADTDFGNITVTLVGTQGEEHRIVNVGSSGNICTLTSINDINGSGSDEILYDSESLDLKYDATEGWF